MESIYTHIDKTYFILRNLFRENHYFYRVLDFKNNSKTLKKIYVNIVQCYKYILDMKKEKVFLNSEIDYIIRFYEKSIILLNNAFKIIMSSNFEFQNYIFEKSHRIFFDFKKILININ